jgi:hypothetical protein
MGERVKGSRDDDSLYAGLFDLEIERLVAGDCVGLQCGEK